MLPPKLLVLALLVTIGHVLEARVSSPDDSTIQGQLLQRWLNDPGARRQLMNVWRSHSSPLAAAFAALNTSDSSHVDDDSRHSMMSKDCWLDVKEFVNSTDMWALSMLDASVKMPVGLFAGAMKHMGNWDECVDQRNIPSFYSDKTFNGQMCMLHINPQLTSRDAEFLYETRANIPTSMLTRMEVIMGVCVPDSCSAKHVQKLFSVLLSGLKVVDGIQLVPSVSDRDCTTRDAPELESGDVVAVMVLSILAALVVMSTVYDAVTPVKDRRALPAAFSVISNGRKLLELPKTNADHTLSCLHGLRFLSMCWVVMIHRYPSTLLLPNINPTFLSHVFQDFFHLFILNGSLSVDTFLVLSGLLLGYLFFKQENSKQRINIPLYYLHRYIRLTPALAIIALLEATLFFHAGWGPLWHSVLDSGHDICKENWWNTLLYVGNYVRPLEVCVNQAWYLMVDMQLHWLSPLVLIPLARKPKWGLAWLLVLSLGGTLSNFLILYLQDKSGNNSGYIEYSLKNFDYFTHTRFVPYLIGLAFGYFLAVRRKSSSEKKALPFIISIVAWLISAGLMLGAFLGYNIFLKPPEPTKLESVFYNTLERPSWSLGVALMVYLCAVGNGGGVNTFLSWWGFHILGRLSYGVYLVHISIQKIQIGNVKTQNYAGDAELMALFCGDLVISLVFAALLSLVCESPFLVLEKELLGPGQRRTEVLSQPISISEPRPPTPTVMVATPNVSVNALSIPDTSVTSLMSEESSNVQSNKTKNAETEDSGIDINAVSHAENISESLRTSSDPSGERQPKIVNFQ